MRNMAKWLMKWLNIYINNTRILVWWLMLHTWHRHYHKHRRWDKDCTCIGGGHFHTWHKHSSGDKDCACIGGGHFHTKHGTYNWMAIQNLILSWANSLFKTYHLWNKFYSTSTILIKTYQFWGKEISAKHSQRMIWTTFCIDVLQFPPPPHYVPLYVVGLLAGMLGWVSVDDS